MLSVSVDALVSLERFDGFAALWEDGMVCNGPRCQLLLLGWHALYPYASNPCLRPGTDEHLEQRPNGVPIQLSKKMWAASEVKVLEQVKVDDRLLIKRAPFIVSLKQGNTGELAFATEATQPLKDGVSIIEETKTIAYKLAVSSQPSTARKVLWEETSEPLISQDLALDEVTLYFLLIIVHQIHYAPPYTTKIEKYPDLVIHSPLLIQLPLNLYRSQPPSTMTDHYMASSTLPNFLGASLAINLAPCYRHVLLWASNYEVQPTLVINVQSWLFN